MWFQDLSGGTQLLTGTRKPGRYGHVGDLIEELDEIIRKLKAEAPADVNPEYLRGVTTALDLFSTSLAKTAVTAT